MCLACKLAPPLARPFSEPPCTSFFALPLRLSLHSSRVRVYRQCFSPTEPASERQRPKTRTACAAVLSSLRKPAGFAASRTVPPTASRARRFILPRRPSLVAKAPLEYITIKRFVPMQCAHTARRATPDTHIIARSTAARSLHLILQRALTEETRPPRNPVISRIVNILIKGESSLNWPENFSLKLRSKRPERRDTNNVAARKLMRRKFVIPVAIERVCVMVLVALMARPPNCQEPQEQELRASLTADPLEAERCNYYVAAVTRRGIRSRERERAKLSSSLLRNSKPAVDLQLAWETGGANEHCGKKKKKKRVINAIALNTRARSTVDSRERLRAFVSVDTPLSMIHVSI